MLSTRKILVLNKKFVYAYSTFQLHNHFIEKTNFHALRHTFATRCIEAGVDVKTLSELLGHSDVKTTLNRYVHSSFELKQKSMEQLEMSLIS